MLVVFLKRKIIIHLDSLHHAPDNDVLNGILNFIQSGSHKDIDWNEWKLYVPQDNPSQISSSGKVGGNCEVHVCTWGYIIASGDYYKFTENDMEVARKGIANFLVRMRISDTT